MKIKILNKSEFDLPRYETNGSSGMDLRANLIKPNKITLEPNIQQTIPTGIFIQLPKPSIEPFTNEGFGYEAEIRPRSGLAAKHGISIVNSPGTIDSDYRGEIKVIMINLTNKPYTINHGDRIAQMIISRFEKISFEETDNLDETKRGDGGFGHTGKK